VPRGLQDRWDRGRLADETIALLRADGAAIRRHLVSDVVSLEDAPRVLTELAERRRHAVQIVIDFAAD
jgi:hypothetical protein